MLDRQLKDGKDTGHAGSQAIELSEGDRDITACPLAFFAYEQKNTKYKLHPDGILFACKNIVEIVEGNINVLKL